MKRALLIASLVAVALSSSVNHLEAGYFPFVKRYLMKDLRYAIVGNNIGGVYLEAGDHDSAKNAFIESIKMTPQGISYPPPHDGLDILGIDLL